MKLTPLKVLMIMELHFSPNFDRSFPNLDSPAQQQALAEFTDENLIATDLLNKTVLTERGQAFVKKILSTQLPQQAWI